MTKKSKQSAASSLNPPLFLSKNGDVNILEELISPLSLHEFQQTYLCKAPYAAPFKAHRFEKAHYWPLLEEIFYSGHNDCWLPNQGLLPSEQHLRQGFLTTEQAREGFQQGRTILIRNAEYAHAETARVATEFASVFRQATIDIQLYCTPAGKEGFDWHYDLADVFVLQSYGEKEFRLKPNTVTPRPLPQKLPKDMQFEKELSRLEIRCHLKAGDWLYIPAGYWHKARAVSESFHISVGVCSSLPGLSASLSCLSDEVSSFQNPP